MAKEIPSNQLVLLENKVMVQDKLINYQKNKIVRLEKQLKEQRKEINYLKNANKETDKEIKNLEYKINQSVSLLQGNTERSLLSVNKDLAVLQGVNVENGKQLTKLNSNLSESSSKLSYLAENVDELNVKNWVVIIVGLFVLFISLGLVYRKVNHYQRNLIGLLRETKQELQDENVKLDTQLLDLLNKKLLLQQDNTSSSSVNDNHKFVLKIADELVRIQKNLSQMDEKTRGLKQLTASVKRIQDNFIANNYELVEMLGKEYNEGMKVIASFIPSEELETGKQIITRVIKPQVNFNGEMIQSAQIEVSVGE